MNMPILIDKLHSGVDAGLKCCSPEGLLRQLRSRFLNSDHYTHAVMSVLVLIRDY